MRRLVAAVTLAAAIAAACGGGAAPAADTSPAAASPPWFADEAAARGLTLRHRSGHQGSTYRLPEIMGGGAALFDMDGDGDLDALLVQSGELGGPDPGPRHRLYRNDGDRPVSPTRPPAAGWRSPATAWAWPPATTTATVTPTST